jgi:DedD protein
MRGVFDDEQLEPVQPRRDTEFTLGSGTLLLIFFGLVLLCGLCFGLGFAFCHRSPTPAASILQPQSASQGTQPISGSLSKPAASEQSITTPSAPVAGAAQPGAEAPETTPAAVAGTVTQSSAPLAASIAPLGQTQVHPAFAAASSTPSVQPSSQPVQPALAPVVPLMVEIAAVADVEDAEVLVSALRKHGYAVTARREPADNLIHVRIGPFSTREDALRWRQKLLNDGYNAIVQP